jgi:CRP-like cAMP-binding protein
MEQFTKTIHKALNKYHQVCERTCQALEKVTEIQVFKENELIEKENEKCISEFIVLEGIVKAFVVNQNGDDITVNFFTDNMAITPTIMRSLDDIAFYNLQVLSKKAFACI